MCSLAKRKNFQNIPSGIPKYGKWKEILKKAPKNDKNTLSKMEDTRTLKASLSGLKITKETPLLVKTINQIPSKLQNKQASPKYHGGLPLRFKAQGQLPQRL